MKNIHLSPFLGAAVLSAALCGDTKVSASHLGRPSGFSVGYTSSDSEFGLPNILSAVAAVDTNGFFPQEIPKSLRGTWQEYDEDRVSKFLSGDLKIVNPNIFMKNLEWEELSEEDKIPVSAVSVMFEQKKATFFSLGLITQEEAQGTWSDLSLERQATFPAEQILPTRIGLDECRAIGCGQFNEDQLKYVIRFIVAHDNEAKARAWATGDTDITYEDAFATVTRMRRAGALNTSITIIDHREEPHLHIKARPAIGYKRSGIVFGDNVISLPMSLYAPADAYSKGQDNLLVEVTEGKLIRSIQKHDVLTLSNIDGKQSGLIISAQNATFAVEEAFSERDMAQRLGLGYYRIPITDHSAMEGEDGDDMRLVYDAKSATSYIIHHCRGGKGRTQTGMVTTDMMRNHKKGLTISDFILRQYLLGGSNLFIPLAGEAEDEWKAPKAYERAKEISNFYAYTQNTKPGICVMFRDWMRKNRS